MTKNTIIGIVVAFIILVVAIVWLLVGRRQGEVVLTPPPAPTGFEFETPVTTSSPVATQAATPSSKTVQITITDTGFLPKTVEISAGSTVTWINNTNREVQIAANPHPVHTGNREVSAGQFVLSIQPGEKKSVEITKTGSFGYHNHLNPGQQGTIVSK